MTATLPPVTRSRVTHLLERMRKAQVAVVGDVMLDRYLIGDTERISPEAPVPVVTVEEEQVVPGGAGNAAVNVAAIGAKPRLVGAVGDDAPAEALREELTALGISPA